MILFIVFFLLIKIDVDASHLAKPVTYTAWHFHSLYLTIPGKTVGESPDFNKIPILLIFFYYFIYLGQVGASKYSNIYEEKYI